MEIFELERTCDPKIISSFQIRNGSFTHHLLTLMLKALVAFCAGLPPSVTRAVKLYVPLVVGVPEMTPVAALSVRPGGNEPEAIDQLYG